MSAEGKEAVVVERRNYLNFVEGGLWTCNPFDDIEAMTTSVVCEQISAGYELPPGYTTVVGSNGFDGDYPSPSNKMTYRNWSEIHDGLTSGRLLDDPTNQTLILAAMMASAPAAYVLGASGSGVVEMLLGSEVEVQAELVASQQVTAAALVPGVTLGSLVQTTTNAIANAHGLSGSQLAQLTDLMEKVEDTLASQPRAFQISILERMAGMPVEYLENILAEDPARYARFINTVARVMQEAPIREVLETAVRISDLHNEDLQATALRTLSEQAIGILPLENPTLASALMRGLPAQISESLGYLNDTIIEADGLTPVSIKFVPGLIGTTEIGPDGVERMSVVVNALIEGVNSAGVHQFMHFIYTLPVPVMQRTVN